MPTVSIVIPCFNAQKCIRDTLRSVTAQNLQHIEVIAIDDGSTDDTATIIEDEFHSVNVLRTANRGPSHARNIGTRASCGKFIQYLDADDLLAPEKLTRQVVALQKSEADVAYGDWQKFTDCPTNSSAQNLVRRTIKGPPELALFGDFWCPPAAYLFRREIVERVGSWNENLPFIQDARFVLDCALLGARFVYCPGVMAFYRVHSSNSVSTRDPIGFVRDCFRNAAEVEHSWREHGGITEERHGALLKAYGHIARASFESDRETFELAYRGLTKLRPSYCPSRPFQLAIASHLVGYRRAESLALKYRKAKRVFHG